MIYSKRFTNVGRLLAIYIYHGKQDSTSSVKRCLKTGSSGEPENYDCILFCQGDPGAAAGVLSGGPPPPPELRRLQAARHRAELSRTVTNFTVSSWAWEGTAQTNLAPRFKWERI